MKIKNRHPELEKSPIVDDLPLACYDEQAALAFFEKARWGDKPTCAHCRSESVYRMQGKASQRRGLWRCHDCKRQYTVRVNSVLSDSPIALTKWTRAVWEFCSSKNGVSALELSRKLQITYKSALFLTHRIRHGIGDDFRAVPKLSGMVEVDECYLGGRPRYRGQGKRGRGTKKQPVIALVQRGGDVRARTIPRVNAHNLKSAIRELVDRSSRIVTDEYPSYRGIGKEFEGGHDTVNHALGEYVRGDAFTNSAESFFARLKRTIDGTYHAVSREHLPKYLDHVAFLHNTRQLTDGQRTIEAIRRTVGKRLRYSA